MRENGKKRTVTRKKRDFNNKKLTENGNRNTILENIFVTELSFCVFQIICDVIW